MDRYKIIFFLSLMLVTKQAICQHPTFRLFIDSVESYNNRDLISSSVKVGNKYISVISAQRKQIILKEDIDPLKIEQVRFVVNKDTIIFPIEQLIEDFDIPSEAFRRELLTILFHSTKKWELRIRQLNVLNPSPTRNVTHKKLTYKIFGLQTISWKYYIGKS